MAEEKKVVTLDDFEQRLMVSGLMDFRNDLLRDEKPTEDINDLILKVIDFCICPFPEAFYRVASALPRS